MVVLSEFPSHPPYMTGLVFLLDEVVARKEEKEVERVIETMRHLKVGQKVIDDVLFYAHLKAGDVDSARAIMTVSNMESNSNCTRYTHEHMMACTIAHTT